MLTHILHAPAAMARHPLSFVWIWGLVALQGVIIILGADFLIPLLFSGNAGEASSSLALGDILLGVIGLWVSIALSFFAIALISSTLQTTATPLGNLIRSSFVVAFVILLASAGLFAITSFVIGLASVLGGIVNAFILPLFAFVGIILVFFATLKLAFTSSFIGKNHSAKDALTESWHFTTGKILSVGALVIVLMIVGSFLSSLPLLVPIFFENEWIQLAYESLYGALSLFFGATVLGLSVRDEKMTHTNRTHLHGKKM